MNIPQITPELKSAVETYLLAQVYLETVRPIVEGYQSEILQEKQYKPTKRNRRQFNENEVILSANRMYLASSDDFAEYDQLTHQAAIDHGFQVEFGYCPLLIAESQLVDAKKLVIDSAEYIAGVTARQVPFVKFETMVDLIVGLVLSACPDITGQAIMESLT